MIDIPEFGMTGISRDLKNIETAWIRWCASSGHARWRGGLDPSVIAAYSYALRLGWMPLPTVGAGLQGFREELSRTMKDLSLDGIKYRDDKNAMRLPKNGGTVQAYDADWDTDGITWAYPKILAMLRDALRSIARNRPDVDLAATCDMLAHKRLAIALGGGGGAGFAHMSLFRMLEEAGVVPALISGTSMGALMGAVRAARVRYDGALLPLKLPSLWRITSNTRPHFWGGEFGLSGMWRLAFDRILGDVFGGMGYGSVPNFTGLEIPFFCVSSAILESGRGLVGGMLGGLMTALRSRNTKSMILNAEATSRTLSQSGKVISINFGLEPGTSRMNIEDAVAFSALVPSVLTYEPPQDHYVSREILHDVFKRHGIYRLADGGVTSNVPTNVIARALQTGRYGHPNVYVLGMDVFAPNPRDGIFYPLEQLADPNGGMYGDRLFADAFVRPSHMLSPINVAPSLGVLRALDDKVCSAIAPEIDAVRFAIQPLPPIESLIPDVWDGIV